MTTGYRAADPSGYSDADRSRRHPEPAKVLGAGVEARGDFARDRARVLHSTGFRRLAGKTQVVAPDDDGVPRTRLTHSLEVAQIGRDIGAQLGADPDLVDLAGLAHDIGHPPFGHNGEQALDAAAAAFGGFEANAQNLRLLTRLEPKTLTPGGEPAGLNLTRAALDAVVKYPWPRPPGGGKFGVYADDADAFGWIRDGAPAGRKCLEAQIMDWSDDVAYSVHDVEDGIASGRIDVRAWSDPAEQAGVAAQAGAGADEVAAAFARLLEMPPVAAGLAAARSGAPRAAAAVKAMTSELIGRFVTGAVAATRAVHGPAPLRRYGGSLVVPAEPAAEVALLKAVAFRYVMDDPARHRMQQRQQELLRELFDALERSAPTGLDPLHRHLFERAGDEAGRRRAVLDQVAALTDAGAVARHRRSTTAEPGGSAAVSGPHVGGGVGGRT